MEDWDRRAFLRSCLAGATCLLSSGCSGGIQSTGRSETVARTGDVEHPDLVPFVNEYELPLEQPFGRGLDGRLFTDLSRLTPGTLLIPQERYFVRTRCSELLDRQAPWVIRIGGLVKQPTTLTLSRLAPMVQPAGAHVMECSGNSSGGHFGLMSAAEWSGVPLTRVLALSQPLPAASRVLISGFDEYPQPSRHRSIPGASWIFTPEQLRDTGAFLATKMNGAPLTPDHGAPVRLVVPGWYGCSSIKWVDRIDWVADTEPATPHMQEFAERTHQDGIPPLAGDYRPAAMEQAAMAVRVERLRNEPKRSYRVTGITWGGPRLTQGLGIRFHSDEAYQPVELVAVPKETSNWALWSYDWQPSASGRYAIQLRIQDSRIPQGRLDRGYYTRRVEL